MTNVPSTLDSRAAMFVCSLVLVAVAPAAARDVPLPLTVPPEVIRDAIVAQVFPEPGERATLWGGEEECNAFILSEPKVIVEAGSVRVLARGEGRVGTDVFGGCWSPIAWTGVVEVVEAPRLAGWQVLFDVVDSNVYDEKGEKTLTGGLWDRAKEIVHPRLESVRIDLARPFEELRAFLPLVLEPESLATADGILASLRPRSVGVDDDGVTIEAILSIPEVPAPPSDPEPQLSPTEVDAFVARLDAWDAFVTFVVRELGRGEVPDAARRALLVVLIDARRAILEALAGPPTADDPIRRLFVDAWTNLRPATRQIAGNVPGAEAFRILTFLGAGNALAALDAAGPTVGLEISADGLRRMARMLAPAAEGDPLEISPFLDPELRRSLGFGPPLEPTPLPAPEPPAGPQNDGSRFWLAPRPAWAATAHADPSEWVLVGRKHVDDYVDRVGRLLDRVAALTIEREKVPGSRAELFLRLFPAVAWQESCWRQFVVRDGKAEPLRSWAGSVGILQINERVWRGFYAIESLLWDVTYNARAGGEILSQFLSMVPDGEPDDRVGRAAYAGYNAGPGAIRRYLAHPAGERFSRLTDELFASKLEAPRERIQAGVITCLVGRS